MCSSLAGRLERALDPGAGPAEAARLLRLAVYDIGAAELPGLRSKPPPLDDATLHHVAGGDDNAQHE